MKKLTLKKITVTNLDASAIQKVHGGRPPYSNPDSYCPICYSENDCRTDELFCNTYQANTCEPCIP